MDASCTTTPELVAAGLAARKPACKRSLAARTWMAMLCGLVLRFAFERRTSLLLGPASPSRALWSLFGGREGSCGLARTLCGVDVDFWPR